MAAKSRAPAAAATQRRAEEEGAGGWLYRVYGRSPSLGDRPLAVYLLHPKLLSPSALGRLAALLSGDARFEGRIVWAWELPRAVAGHAVVDLKAGRALAALPEDARKALPEIARALEELSARRPAAALDWGALYLDELTRLRDWLREKGVTSFTMRALAGGGGGTAVELHPPRPMGPEERRELWKQLPSAWGLDPKTRRRRIEAVPLVEEAEARMLEGIGLGALAELAPQLCWVHEGASWDGGASWSWDECAFTLWIAEAGSPRRLLINKTVDALKTDIEGARGAARVSDGAVYAKLRRLDGDLLRHAEEAAEAAGEMGRLLDEWYRLCDRLWEAERMLIGAAPLTAAVEEGTARAWEEGGGIKVWVSPETAASIAGMWGGSVSDYLGALSRLLDEEVELAARGEGLPLVSPEVDAAHRRLVAALRELVGAA